MKHLTDFILRLGAALHKKKLYVEVPLTKVTLLVLWSLYKGGFISGYAVKKTIIVVYLKYFQGKSVMYTIVQVSKISKRIYCKSGGDSKKSLHSLLTTSKGIYITNLDERVKHKDGGEVFFNLK